jgi:hypothetical protein
LMASKPAGHVVAVPCRGGPHANDVFRVWTWGVAPGPAPTDIYYDTQPDGRYVLRGGVYVWETIPS